MFYTVKGRKEAKLEGDVAVVKSRNYLRLTHLRVDYVNDEIRCTYHWGVWNVHSGVFEITDREAVVVEITGETARGLISAQNGGWAGDISLAALEQAIMRGGYLNRQGIEPNLIIRQT